ncbi:MAG: PPC domain-containing protein [Planctomycetota bacterium]
MNAGARLASLLLCTCVCAAASAQEDPHVGYAYPAGVQRGTVREIVVGGQHLEEPSAARFTGTGITAEVVVHALPLDRGILGALRDRLQEIQEKQKYEEKEEDARFRRYGIEVSKVTKAEFERLAAIVNNPKRQPNAQLGETVVLRVTVAQDAEPGSRELRLIAKRGVSNPIRFLVGEWPEHDETEPNDKDPDAVVGDQLPAVINGQILPGDVDRFRFDAQAGDRIVIAARARELIPYLADAVPGWFQATLSLYDVNGEEVAYTDDYRFQPDPLLSALIPEDGSYVLEVRDSIYRGREDFVYRLELSKLPFVTGSFPLGGRSGAVTPLSIMGWNLPPQRLTVDGREMAPGVHAFDTANGQQLAASVPFALDTLPEQIEREENDVLEKAERIKLPVIVNGRIDPAGDRDVFEIKGYGGQTIVAEVTARRLNSPLDSVLRLLDSEGREIASNDDHEDPAAGLITHQADSLLEVRLPQGGAHYLQITDLQSQGGAAYGYRLRISKPLPDFELRVVPSSVNVQSGTSVPLTVHALRKDGFKGEIKISLADAPPGFSLAGGSMPGDSDQLVVTLTTPDTPPEGPVPLTLVGRSHINGREVKRVAVPADDMMQAFLNRHLVPAEELLVAVTGSERSQVSVKFASPLPVKLPAGGTAEVHVLWSVRAPGSGTIRFKLDHPPPGITIQESNLYGGRAMFLLHADRKLVERGGRGNLIVEVYREYALPANGVRPGMAPSGTLLGVLPAIPYKIVGS